MLIDLIIVIGAAAASSHEWGVSAGVHGSVGTRTGLPVMGPEVSLIYRRQGQGRSGLQIELQDLWSVHRTGSSHLLGTKLGWTRDWGDRASGRQGYSFVGVGGYSSELLSVLPILWLETGIEWRAGSHHWRLGPELYMLPTVFVGSGLRVSVTSGERR